MKNKVWTYLVFGCLLGWVNFSSVFAVEQRIRFKHLTPAQGLSQSTVNCIVEDHRGFMWFGTQEGLNKYDGYQFTVYRTDIQDPYSISSDFIISIYEDRNKNLWIGTRSDGLNRFDFKTERFYRYQAHPGEANRLSHNTLNFIFQDSRQNYWVGTPNGLNRFEPEKGTFFHYRYSPFDKERSVPVISMLEDAAGVLWVGSAYGLCRFNREKGTFITYFPVPDRADDLASNAITSMVIDHTGLFWVGVRSGLYLFDPSTGSFSIRFKGISLDSFANTIITSIYEDHAFNLWVGTYNGLYRFDYQKKQFIHYQSNPNDASSLSLNVINSLYENSSGIIWAGTGGSGVDYCYLPGEYFTTVHADFNKGGFLTKNSVSSFLEDKQGVWWIGFIDGGMDRVSQTPKGIQVTHFQHDASKPGSLGSGRVSSLCEDSRGILWVGIEPSGLERFEPLTESFIHFKANPDDPTTLTNNEVSYIVEDFSGRLWVSTYSLGINRLNRETGQFMRYVFPKDEVTSTATNKIVIMLPSRSGCLWLGTDGGGLVKFDPQTTHSTVYHSTAPSGKGPSSNLILALYEDRNGILWLGTYQGGLNRFDPKSETFSYIRVKDGLPNDVIYGILEDEQHQLWLSTNYGLACYNPQNGSCKNYTDQDGLQANEFNNGVYFKNKQGLMFFGGPKGLNVFKPSQIVQNRKIPPVVLTDFLVFNNPVLPGAHSILRYPITETQEITLSYQANMFAFEFAALDFTIPEKNKYAYKMEGFDNEWIYTTAQKRFASYTNLDPGTYTFRVKGSNNDGVWNPDGVALKIVITPPLTRTWWFRLSVVLFVVGLSVFLYRYRTQELAQRTRLKTELQTARDAQMSIMPHHDPILPRFEVSGLCVPANEVGGDFFDYFWLNEEKTRLGIAVGDVSGKGMKAAMTAIMSSGILFAKAAEYETVHDILTQTNRLVYSKTDRRMFTALCFAALDMNTYEFVFANAGLCHPLIKSNGSMILLRDGNSQYPLGLKADTVYREKKIALKTGDVVLIITDGIPETQDNNGQFLDYGGLKECLEKINTDVLSAVEIKNLIIAEAHGFAGSAPQHDDMTIVVLKVLEDK